MAELAQDTYRYHGHSISDPGSTYRTRDEIAGVRRARDPIEHVRTLLMENNFAEAKELKQIERDVKKVRSTSFDQLWEVMRMGCAARSKPEPVPIAHACSGGSRLFFRADAPALTRACNVPAQQHGVASALCFSCRRSTRHLRPQRRALSRRLQTCGTTFMWRVWVRACARSRSAGHRSYFQNDDASVSCRRSLGLS